MSGEPKVPALPRRVARLLIGTSALRRPSDRVEGVVAVLLTAAFLVGLAAAAFLGWRFCQTQYARAASLHPSVAVVSQTVPAADGELPATEAAARWRAPDGRQRSGILTTDTAPGIWGAEPGNRVGIWETASGVPVPPPPGPAAVMLTAVVMATAAAGGAGIALGICYVLCRLILDRRRLAQWESDWALTGPRWTMRR
jgi:hypothetical protein